MATGTEEGRLGELREVTGIQYAHREPNTNLGRYIREHTRTVPPVELNPDLYEIQIKRYDNFYEVKVGCRTFGFATRQEVYEAVELFYTDMEQAARKYLRCEGKSVGLAPLSTPETPNV